MHVLNVPPPFMYNCNTSAVGFLKFLQLMQRFLTVLQRLFFCSYRGNFYMSNDKQKTFTFHIDIWICTTQVSSIMQKLFFQLSREDFTRHSKADIAWHVDIISQVMQGRFHQLFRCTFYQSCRKVFTDLAKTVFACHRNTVFPEVMQGSF